MWTELGSGVIGTLIGGFAGHRLAIGRDRRKERNEVREPMFIALDKLISDKNPSRITLSKFPKAATVDSYKARVGSGEFKRFERLVDELRQFAEKNGGADGFGGRILPPTKQDELHRRHRALLKHTRQR
ncbi:hypothetical protein ACOJCM_11700 [Billgrantia sp. LNSP4103-1]|uniref:hypothetical protein n=1 Tax=Billgrantia sp. LNSP4103-1 TaxID=3410266 RepID=UPI00403F0B18